jgi:hypothetical protein
MTTLRSGLVLSLAAAAILALAGCQTKTSSDGSGTPGPAAAGHDHDHDHEHHHYGPHGGHLMVIGDEEYHAEWTHDGNGEVRFYILDAAAKNEVPIAAPMITIDVQVGENEPTTFELFAVDPQGEEMKTALFMTVDKELEGALEALSGVTATLNVTIDGKEYRQKIEEHHHDH